LSFHLHLVHRQLDLTGNRAFQFLGISGNAGAKFGQFFFLPRDRLFTFRKLPVTLLATKRNFPLKPLLFSSSPAFSFSKASLTVSRWRLFRFFRCAYQAKVMKILDMTSSTIVLTNQTFTQVPSPGKLIIDSL
jgi:hypothetical protein